MDNRAYIRRLTAIIGSDNIRTAQHHLLHCEPPVRHRRVGNRVFITGEAFRFWVQQGGDLNGGNPPEGDET